VNISVNGVGIPAEAIAQEAPFHADADDPNTAAARALAIRELLLQRARELGLDGAEGADPDAAIDTLIGREVATPVPTEEECGNYYRRHPQAFRSGDLVEAAHILFAVTPNAPLEAIREQAEAILREARAEPGRFGELASRFSNCPSGAQGGSLGQLGRGDTVPEFAQALFEGTATGVLPQLVKSRYGFHVVLVNRRVEGSALPFEAVHTRIAEYLAEGVKRRALSQYVRILAGQARITGVELEPAETPLVR
jgi:peptidyl-prolyl cis-trans isomerase C